MKELIKEIKDFKIIPNNFNSASEFDLISIEDENINIHLNLIDNNEIKDYIVNENVEVFGVNSLGLIYFETKIIKKEGCNLTLALNQDYSIIQRREYSRVSLEQGKVTFNDISQDFILKIEDISAGGLKIITSKPLEIDKHYDIEIALSNNMKIQCKFQPIRIKEESNNKYLISGKFVELENVDRIVLVQYAFKIKMEQQNKNNN